MPRISEQRITNLPQQGQQQAGRQVRSQVLAGPADNLPSYIPQTRDPNAEALINGLATFQPKLAEWAAKKDDEAAQRGQFDRAAGKEKAESSSAYANAYFATDGLVKGQTDAADLVTKYNTEFDKDKGDLEGWLAEQNGNRLKNVSDQSYITGYQKGMLPAFAAIREAHLGYQKKAVETRVESNAMQLLDNGMRAYVSQSTPVPDSYIESIQDYTEKNLGVSKQRFGELLFETSKKIGDEGHHEVYDLLKKDRPDGSPGIYYDPQWKAKIDAAQEHSFTVSQQRAHVDRDNRQNAALLPVFMEEDPKKAQAMFAEMRKSGLFTRTDDLIKWDKLMVEKVDGKPSLTQLENETKLLAKVYEGKLKFRNVINSNSSADITAGQRKYLLGEINKVENQNRTLAATAGKADEAVFKTRNYADAKDYLGSVLQPRPHDPQNFTDDQARRLEFDRRAAADAQREFFTKLQGKKPEEIQPLAEEIATRYLKKRQEMSPDQQSKVVENKVPFKTIVEMRDAAAKGLLSPAEVRTYHMYFKGNK